MERITENPAAEKGNMVTWWKMVLEHCTDTEILILV